MKNIFTLALVVLATSLVFGGAKCEAQTTGTQNQQETVSKFLVEKFKQSYGWCRDWGLQIYDYCSKSEVAKHDFFKSVYSMALKVKDTTGSCVNYAGETCANLFNVGLKHLNDEEWHDYIDGHVATMRDHTENTVKLMHTRSLEAQEKGKKVGYHHAIQDVFLNTCSFIGDKAKSSAIVAKDFFVSPKLQSTVKSFTDTAHAYLHKAAGVCKEGAGHVYNKVTDPEFHQTVTTTTKNVCETAFISVKGGANHVVQCSQDFVERCKNKGLAEGVKESLYMTATWLNICGKDSYDYITKAAGSQYKTWFENK